MIYNLLSLTIDQLLDHLDEHFLVARVRHTEVTESIDVHGWWVAVQQRREFPWIPENWKLKIKCGLIIYSIRSCIQEGLLYSRDYLPSGLRTV